MVRPNTGPRGGQTWRTFIRNYVQEIRACDLLVQHAAFLAVAYDFVITEIGSRLIVHVNVTTNPRLDWVKQQIREATAWDQVPRFLVHDNDGIFGQFGRPVKLEGQGRTRPYRCHLDRWLDQVMGIEGLPIPHGAPNASPHVERDLWPASNQVSLARHRHRGPLGCPGRRRDGVFAEHGRPTQ